MHLNADFSQRVVIDSEKLPWVASPLPGVERRMLERIGDEVARATSIVRYAEGSAFSAHTHGGGEEFLVLDGVFSDEHGDFGPGTYIRNPPGSSHTPRSEAGCTIFVKLWQMHPADDVTVRLDTSSATWRHVARGVEVLALFERPPERVALLRADAGTGFEMEADPGGQEILVLDGAFADREGHYGKGCWIRNPPGREASSVSDKCTTTEGCLLFVKTGHLAEPPQLPDVAAA